MARWVRWTLGIVAALVVAAAVLWLTPTSDYVILPGVTENLNRIVNVQSALGNLPSGKMLMVAVDIEPANLFYYLIGKYTPYGEIIPAQELLGSTGNEQQYQQVNMQLMTESHLDAKVAALRQLGYSAKETGQGVYVYSAEKNTPAAGRLKPNDVIVAVNGTPVPVAQDLLNFMGHVTPGQKVTLKVLRDKKDISVSVGTIKSTQLKNHAMLGVLIATYKPNWIIPLKINIKTGDISGPSAGMMFSLSIIDHLRPQFDLTHGQTIAGTGTIDANGNVGAIGGIKEKVVTVYDAGARIFLVPKGDYADAIQEAKAIGISQKMRIIPVGTLAQAVAALEHH